MSEVKEVRQSTTYMLQLLQDAMPARYKGSAHIRGVSFQQLKDGEEIIFLVEFDGAEETPFN